MSGPGDLEAFLRIPAGAFLLVVTGAGVSHASGIPTFRGSDPGAVWSRDVTELGTRAFFERDPVASWRWYLGRFEAALAAEPNPAHAALAALERWHLGRGGGFLLATQNVDTLHEQAGSREMIKLHGSIDRVRCSRTGCEHGAPAGSLPRSAFDLSRFRDSPGPETLPRCPRCGTVVRQHVLWFDETYDSHRDYAFGRFLEASARADRILFVGTSFAVGATAAVLESAWRSGAGALSIDPGGHAPPPGVLPLRERAEEALPRACRAVGALP